MYAFLGTSVGTVRTLRPSGLFLDTERNLSRYYRRRLRKSRSEISGWLIEVPPPPMQFYVPTLSLHTRGRRYKDISIKGDADPFLS